MTILPVLRRELGAQARHPGTYWVRLAGAAVLTVVFAVGLRDERGLPAEVGRRLFAALNLFIYYVIWLCVPALAADCVSVEKREGTLGLLFLTPLRAWEIVVGKAIIQGLAGWSLMVGAVPMLYLPGLLGGVTARDAAISGLIHLAAFVTAAAVGVAASALSERPLPALARGLGLAVILAIPLNTAISAIFDVDGVPLILWPRQWVTETWALAPGSLTNARMAKIGVGMVLGVSVIAGLLVGRAAWQVQRFWQPAPAGPVSSACAFDGWLKTLAQITLLSILLLAPEKKNAFLRPSQFLMGYEILLAAVWLTIPMLVVNQLTCRAPADDAAGGGCYERPRADASSPRHEVLWPYFVVLCLVEYGPDIVQGSLSGLDLGLIALIYGNMLCLAVGAAFLAQVRTKRWLDTQVTAVIFSLGLLMIFCLAHGLLIQHAARHLPDGSLSRGARWEFSEAGTFQKGTLCLNRILAGLGHPALLDSPATRQVWAWDAGLLAGLSAAFMLGAWRLWHARRGQTRHPIGRTTALSGLREYCEPILARRWLSGRTQRLLNTNPALWLQRRGWGSRAATWLWGLGAAIGACLLDPFEVWWDPGAWLWGLFRLLLLFVLALALAAASSFRAERRSGVLELLLISPLGVRRLLWGRLASLWLQFLPAFAIVGLFMWLGRDAHAHGWRSDVLSAWLLCLLLIESLVALPFLGTYFALRTRSLAASWVLASLSAAVFTCLFAVLGALLGLTGPLAVGSQVVESATAAWILVANLCGQILVAWKAWQASQRQLECRSFAAS